MLTALLLAAAAVSSDAATCESLQSLALPETTITSAAIVPAGPFTTTPASATQKPQTFQIPVEACRITGVIKPQVKFEVWMPASNWNGKFQGVGGGGFAGVISYGAMVTALGRGYATASTDTGHSMAGGSWALNRPDLVLDYAYRAIHEMTVKSKEIVKTFYGNAPRLSYFVGCSTGGRQGLMEAQRFPADYDGIVAGAPANYWTHLMAGTLWNAIATMKEETRLSPAKFTALNKGALAACDAGDGVTDGLISNPPACKFDPGTLVCSGAETDACLTAPQVEAARKIYAGSTHPQSKKKIFPGMAPGGEITWTATAGQQPFAIPADFYKYFVYSNPDWDWKQLDFDKDVALADDKFAKLMNAVDPDLDKFKERGGKLIMYHGWNDQLIQPGNSIDYFTSVQKKMGEKDTDEFARLFMAPGMQHCAGGVGPNTFNAVAALEEWVEKGTKPAQIVASHTSNGVVDRTRPLCPYPQVATYKGSGSFDEAASFVCK
jgi:feruloyl esterase